MDTSVLVQAERAAASMVQFAMDLERSTGEQRLGVAVISLTELAQEKLHPNRPGALPMRELFMSNLRSTFTVHALTESTAIRAGLLNGTLQANGLTIGLADVLIAATALQLGFGVLTHNRKHFDCVPDLRVVAAQS